MIHQPATGAVLQNHVPVVTEKSNGRKRTVPSSKRETKPCVPPPSMCPRPTTPSTVKRCVGRPARWTVKMYWPDGSTVGMTRPSAKTMGVPSKGATTVS